MKTKNMTGYPSMDRPWMKYYDENAGRADGFFKGRKSNLCENAV